MFQPLSEEAEGTFHDASAYFSEEEWKLLQEWQKELYQNVMKEIHQALLSLGPLITTTVFSLRAKEKQELYLRDYQEMESRHTIPFPPTDGVIMNPGLFSPKEEEKFSLNNPEDTDVPERNDYLSPVCLRKEEEPVAFFIDHLGKEVIESSTDHSLGLGTVSFHIKDEEETYCIERQDRKRKESISPPTGNECVNFQKKVVESTKYTRTAKTVLPSLESKRTKALQLSHKGENSSNQLPSEGYQKMRREKSAQSETDLSNSQHYIVHTGRTKVRLSQIYNEHGSNSQVLNTFLNSQQRQNVFTGSKCNKSYSLKKELTKHMGAHSKVGGYSCTECEKCFFQKTQLIKHYRTHTGEKQYICPLCQKRFSRKDILNGHIRIHTGEKPYKCPECERSFPWKSNLNHHRRKHHLSHTGVRIVGSEVEAPTENLREKRHTITSV